MHNISTLQYFKNILGPLYIVFHSSPVKSVSSAMDKCAGFGGELATPQTLQEFYMYLNMTSSLNLEATAWTQLESPYADVTRITFPNSKVTIQRYIIKIDIQHCWHCSSVLMTQHVRRDGRVSTHSPVPAHAALPPVHHFIAYKGEPWEISVFLMYLCCHPIGKYCEK